MVAPKKVALISPENSACRPPDPYKDLKKSGPTEYPIENRNIMKKNIFIGPDIGMRSCPMRTPMSSTDVTLPSWKFPIRMRPIRNPSPIVRNSANGGYCLNISTNQSIIYIQR